MILENRRLRNTIRMASGTITVGSDPACNVHLPDPRLGAHQARLVQDDDGIWWLEVLDLSTPTCLNRAIQKTRAKLRHADEIEMGPFSIRFFTESNKTREELRHERLLALTKAHGKTLPLGTLILKEGDPMSVSREQLEQMTLLAMRLSQLESAADTLTPTLRAMLRTFEAHRGWIGLRKGERGDFDWTLGLARNGKPCARPSFSETTQPRCMEHAQHLCVPSAPTEGVGSAMAVPLLGQAGTIGMLYVENDQGDAPYDSDRLNTFRAMASCAGPPIEKVLRQSMMVRRETVRTELTIARSTQDAITLSALPKWPELQVAAYRHMGSTHCCDFYDIAQLRDKTAAIIVAKLRVELQALPMFFAELRAAFRSAALYSEAPHLFARALNWMLYVPESGNAIDLAAAWVCPKSGRVRLCTAGTRVRLARVTAEGECEPVPTDEAPSICQTRSPAFESRTLELEHGQSLAVITDGVDAARSAEGAVFGKDGVDEALCDGVGAVPGQVLSEFAADLTEFLSGGEHPDDITLVLLRRE
ncbi:MAG: SpoIIE family protein phosphatase [Phycisphaerae bacterium]